MIIATITAPPHLQDTATTSHEAGQSFTDPVCGMQVTADPNRKIEYAGQQYYFCSNRCMEKFRSEPSAYIGSAQPPAPQPARRRNHLYLPDASGNPPAGSRPLPALRHGAGTGDADAGRGRKSGIERFQAALLVDPAADPGGVRAGHVRPCVFPDGAALSKLDRTGGQYASGAVGRLAVFRALGAVHPAPPPEYVDPDRLRRRRRLRLQRGGDDCARPVSAGLLRARAHRRLFRSGRRHRFPDAVRANPRTAGALANLGRHQGAARTGAQDGAPHRRRWQRGRRAARPCPYRRHLARAARRESAGGRRRHRRRKRDRRIDAVRRTDSGHQTARRQADRRHAQYQRQPGDARGKSRLANHAVANRADGRAGAALAGADAAPGGRRGRLLRRHRDRHRAADAARLGPVRLRAELGIRLRHGGVGADHRLPLRARTGDADVDHGRHRPRGDPGHPVSRCRRDRGHAPGRYADRRQDRHPDRRQAGV